MLSKKEPLIFKQTLAFFSMEKNKTLLLKIDHKNKLRILIFDIQKNKFLDEIKTEIEHVENHEYWIFKADDVIYVLMNDGILIQFECLKRPLKITRKYYLRIPETQKYINCYFLKPMLALFESTSQTILFFSFSKSGSIKLVNKIQFNSFVYENWKQKGIYLIVNFSQQTLIFSMKKASLIYKIERNFRVYDFCCDIFCFIGFNFNDSSLNIFKGSKKDEDTENNHHSISLIQFNFKKIENLRILFEESEYLVYFCINDYELDKQFLFVFNSIDNKVLIWKILTGSVFPKNLVPDSFSHKIGYSFSEKEQTLEILKINPLKENKKNYICKVVSSFNCESVFEVKKVRDTKKAAFYFDSTAAFICQKGIYKINFEFQKVSLIYSFPKIEDRELLNFDFEFDKTKTEIGIYTWNLKSNNKIESIILFIDNNKNSTLKFENVRQTNIFSVEKEGNSARVIQLTSCRH